MGAKNAKWPFHVAIVVDGQLEGQIVKVVIDPAISPNHMTIQQWLSAMTPNTMTELKDVSLLIPDHKIAKATDNGQYWISSFKSAGLAKSGGIIIPNKNSNIYFELDKGFTSIEDMMSGYKPDFSKSLLITEKAIPQLKESMKLAELATRIGEGLEFESILSNYTLSERVKLVYKYRFTTSISEAIENAKIKFFTMDVNERNLAEAALELCGGVYSSVITKFKTKMQMVFISNKNAVFMEKYAPLIEEAKIKFKNHPDIMSDLGLL